MKRTTTEAKDQQMVVPAGRRGFLRRAGATALAAIAAAGVPVEASATASVAVKDANGFVQSAPIDPVQQLADYNMAILSHLCLASELMREWYLANEQHMEGAARASFIELHDLTSETRSSARTVARTAGIEIDMAYIAKRRADFDLVANAVPAMPGNLTAQQRQLLNSFNNMKDSAQQTLVDVAEEWAESLPRAAARGVA